MMKSNTIKELSRENRDHSRHLRHRKVSIPRKSAHRALKQQFTHQVESGAFKNTMYTAYSPALIMGVYIKNLLLFILPAFILFQTPVMLIKFVSFFVEGTELIIPSETTYFTLIYGAAVLLGLRRANDQMAYYNIHAVVGKHELNQLVYKSMMHGASEKLKEFAVMENYRMRFNKVALFSSVKELAIEEQLFQKALQNKKENVLAYAEHRREALSLTNKRHEHYAAKAIADQKQQVNGGKNEYDEMVRKYKHRMAPQIKAIVTEVQNNY